MTYKTNATILINEIGVGNSVDVYYQHTQSNSGNNSGNENNQGNNEQNNQEDGYEMTLCDWSSDVCSSDLFIYQYCCISFISH